jgi:hypothetical protein
VTSAGAGRGRSERSARLRAVGAGLLAAAFSFMYQSPGVVLTPDGWAYWEGSVSLLAGEGLRHLGGQPLGAWPPLFPLYLAAWQSALGTFAGTLAVAQAAALGLAAALLVAAAERLAARDAPPFFRGALALALALVPAIALREVLSESLFAVFLGGALLVASTVQPEGDRDTPSALRLGVATPLFTALVAGLVLTRHQGLAFVPGLAWLFARRALGDARRARAMALALLAVAGGAWLVVRVALGQMGSHRPIGIDDALAGRVVSATWSNLSGGWSLVAPASLPGVTVVAMAVVAVAMGLRRFATHERAVDAAVQDPPPGLTAAAAVSTLLTLALLAATGMVGSRFVMPLALLLLVVLPSRGSFARRAWRRRAVVAFTIVLAAVQAWRGVRWAIHVSEVGPVGVPWSAELAASCGSDPACRSLPGTVTPPDLPWVDRNWKARRAVER